MVKTMLSSGVAGFFLLMVSGFAAGGVFAETPAAVPDKSTIAVSSSVSGPASEPVSGLLADDASLPSAPEPQAAQSPAPGGAAQPDLSKPGLSKPGQAGPGQAGPGKSGPENGLSLGDLGFSTAQTQGSAQQQALLNKRTHMLKVHQTLGLITAVPMLATLITGPQAKAKGKNGQPITEPTAANLDVHIALGGLTTGLYFATAYYAMRAPKISDVKPKGAIRIHRDLEWVHGPGMILTPILGIMAYKQENSGEKVSGIASAHAPVAYVTTVAYCASIVAVSWPIHWKFWR